MDTIPDILRELTELLALLLPWLGRPEAMEATIYRAALVLGALSLTGACSTAIVAATLTKLRRR